MSEYLDELSGTLARRILAQGAGPLPARLLAGSTDSRAHSSGMSTGSKPRSRMPCSICAIVVSITFTRA